MFRFVLGFFSIMVAIVLWDAGTGVMSRGIQADRFAGVGLLLCLIPTLVAWGAARMIHTMSPRRVFDGVLVGRSAPLLLGSLAASSTVVTTAVSLALLAPPVTGPILFCVLSAMTTGCVVLICRRRRAGYCRGCGYDISASLGFGRCPECGGQLCG